MQPAFHIGSHQVFHIEEWQGGFAPPADLFAEYEKEAFDRLKAEFEPDYFKEGLLYAFLQSWVISTGEETVLVDTGAGNDKDRPHIPVFGNLKTDFLDRLRAAGFAPASIDKVFCTHLHIDHVGWNTVLKEGAWVPTFPTATYYFPRIDDEVWDPSRSRYAAMKGAAVNMNVYEDSVRPIIEAGQAVFVEDGDEIAPGMIARAAPGHTPGQMFLEVSSDGQHAMFTGDILHHPMQIFRPDWNSVYCEDREQAAATRRAVLDRACERGARIVPAHFGGVHSTYVERNGSGFRPRFPTD